MEQRQNGLLRSQLSTVLIVLTSLTATKADSPSVGKFDLSLIEQIPDLVQTDPKGKFERGGKSYCGPVAASNSLVWLKAGSDGKFTDTEKQYEVVNRLASPEYMKTDPVKGVGANGMIRGIRRFVEEDIGDKNYKLAYQGWRSTPEGHFNGVREPELEWIRSSVGRGKSAWLNVGWYRHHEEKDEYERVGGHWVTIVGYGADEEGKLSDRIIVVHDPSPRCGEHPHEYVILTPIKKGTLTGKKGETFRSSVGLFLMGGGMHIKSIADVAILDGVIGLDLDVETEEAETEP